MATANTVTTVDIVVFRQENDAHVRNGRYSVLLIQRLKEPYQGMWALPGGKVDEADVTLEQAAIRELREETHIIADTSDLTLVGVYGDKDRDPRGRYVSVAYELRYNGKHGNAVAGDDAGKVEWFPFDKLPPLAFDHQRILNDFSYWMYI